LSELPAIRGYFQLDGSQVRVTADLLHQRIEERFPSCGLSQVAGEVSDVVDLTAARVEDLSRPF
jgi:hypothetical protein